MRNIAEQLRGWCDDYDGSRMSREASPLDGLSCGMLLDAANEIEQLRGRLDQIAIACTDNMDADCNHRMALDFVRQIASAKLARGLTHKKEYRRRSIG